MNLHDNKGYNLLIKALVAIDNETDCEAFLEDLITRKELLDIELCEQFIYFIYKVPLPGTPFVNIFSHSVSCLFILSVVSFAMQKL